MDFVPIVVSVPKCIKCRSRPETKVNTVAVGLLLMAVALVVTPLLGLHSNDLPFFIVAISTVPKLSNDQLAGSRVTSVAEAALFQATKFVASVTTAASLCAARVDPKAPLVMPVKSLLEIPV